MKYTLVMDIQKPLEEVVRHWQNPDNLVHWQEGFQGYEHISGEPGTVGAKTMLKYDMNGRTLDLEETIIENNLPHSFSAIYDCDPMTNTMTCRFSTNDDGSTRYESEFEYTRLKGIMMKFMMRFFPGIFRKQTQKWNDNFKAWVESQ